MIIVKDGVTSASQMMLPGPIHALTPASGAGLPWRGQGDQRISEALIPPNPIPLTDLNNLFAQTKEDPPGDT
jgi:hypothetical protein